MLAILGALPVRCIQPIEALNGISENDERGVKEDLKRFKCIDGVTTQLKAELQDN